MRRSLVGFVLVGSVAVAGCSTSNPLASGRGTAVISWKGTGGPAIIAWDGTGRFSAPTRQSFSGSIEGLPVSGIATTVLNASDIQSLVHPSPGTLLHVFQWRGTFDGKPFSLGVYAGTGSLAVLGSPGNVGFTVRGIYGSMKVLAAVSASNSDSTVSSVASFIGSIGPYRVSGVVNAPTGSGTHHSSTASFTIG
jgi:hypothetical protein